MIENTEGPANVVPRPRRSVIPAWLLVVGATVSAGVSFVVYVALGILALFVSGADAFVSGMSGGTPPPKPTPPYGPQGLELIMSPWLIFAVIVALRWIWCSLRGPSSEAN